MAIGRDVRHRRVTHAGGRQNHAEDHTRLERPAGGATRRADTNRRMGASRVLRLYLTVKPDFPLRKSQ
jgi:hypothetical protein